MRVRSWCMRVSSVRCERMGCQPHAHATKHGTNVSMVHVVGKLARRWCCCRLSQASLVLPRSSVRPMLRKVESVWEDWSVGGPTLLAERGGAGKGRACNLTPQNGAGLDLFGGSRHSASNLFVLRCSSARGPKSLDFCRSLAKRVEHIPKVVKFAKYWPKPPLNWPISPEICERRPEVAQYCTELSGPAAPTSSESTSTLKSGELSG